MQQELQELFRSSTGEQVVTMTELSAAGSNRRYFRIKSAHHSRIGVAGVSADENRAFIYLSGHLRKKGIAVPQVYAVSGDGMYYMQEDLGDCLLFDALAESRTSGRYGEKEFQLLKKIITALPVLQCRGAEGMDFSFGYPQASFDRRTVFWDLNYFKYCFLKAVGIEFQEDRLEDDFERMADILLEEPFDTFMYRDFQSRNVMICDGEPFFIDFQGGRKGPLYYDVASFLWQARAAYPDELREQLLEAYIEALQPFRPIDSGLFRARLRHFVLFRLLQLLGAYGYRGYFEKKSAFVQAIPDAVELLAKLLEPGFPDYPCLSEALQALTGLEKYRKLPPAPGLTVTVYSFSYKKGIPEDYSGNGGGFVFDCRAVHNPGKYEEYKNLTGLDEPVIRFLESDGEILEFLKAARQLTDASVERYLARGFTDLAVCFGCTGGRHRSVYSARSMAEHLRQKYGIRVILIHRELDIQEL
ncbi:MAG: phosphotransferase [Culturomica sp.]|jgi:aminoglycoside/choline kinase family phosphotransferase|nr:phosphotransferase [Culturomica sp.]